MKRLDWSLSLMYLDLVSWSAIISDQETEGKKRGVAADWEVEQYRNNRAVSTAAVLNVEGGGGWGYMFRKYRKKRIHGYYKFCLTIFLIS